MRQEAVLPVRIIVANRLLQEARERRLPGIPIESIGGLLELLPVEQPWM